MQLPSDPVLRELLPEFLHGWQHELQRVLEAAQAHNEAELYRLGHTLKGTSLQFGLTELAELGIELMECARTHAWDDVVPLCERIRAELRSVQCVLANSQGER